jgi:hypothetical protein
VGVGADIYKFSTCFNRERKSLLSLQQYGGAMLVLPENSPLISKKEFHMVEIPKTDVTKYQLPTCFPRIY